jgi:hypothetical protein
MMASSIKTVSWGGNDGEIFEKRLIKKISLHTSTCVNQIGINKDKHGSGGVDRGEIILAPDEHINKVNIRSSVGIDFAEFTTNKAVIPTYLHIGLLLVLWKGKKVPYRMKN